MNEYPEFLCFFNSEKQENYLEPGFLLGKLDFCNENNIVDIDLWKINFLYI